MRVWRPALVLGTTVLVACSLTALDGFSGGGDPPPDAADANEAGASDGQGGDGTTFAPTLGKVLHLRLVNTTTAKSVDGFDAIPEEAKLPFSTTPKMTIEAITDPVVVGSVKFVLTGSMQATNVENLAPYTINDAMGYAPWAPKPGPYTLEVTPFPLPGASGTAGPTFVLHFTVE